MVEAADFFVIFVWVLACGRASPGDLIAVDTAVTGEQHPPRAGRISSKSGVSRSGIIDFNNNLIPVRMLSKKTKAALDLWLSMYPESDHPCDMERFYSLIKVSSEQSDLDYLVAMDLVDAVKSAQPEWDDEFAREFAEDWGKNISLCRGLMEYLNKE